MFVGKPRTRTKPVEKENVIWGAGIARSRRPSSGEVTNNFKSFTDFLPKGIPKP